MPLSRKFYAALHGAHLTHLIVCRRLMNRGRVEQSVLSGFAVIELFVVLGRADGKWYLVCLHSFVRFDLLEKYFSSAIHGHDK